MRVAIGCVVLAACGASSAPHRTDTTAHAAAAAAQASPFLIDTSSQVLQIARDGDWLYWVDDSGIHRRPVGDATAGPSTLVSNATAGVSVSAFAVAGDRYLYSDGTAVQLITGKHDPKEVLAASDQQVVAVAILGDDAIIAKVDRIVRAPLAGGAAKILARGQKRIAGLAATADHVYWTDYGEEPMSPPPYGDESTPGIGFVRRVALDGGKIETLAGGQRGPSAITIAGDRVWWTDDRGPGLQSAGLDGKQRKLERAPAADRLAIDDAGVVLHEPSGYVLERVGKQTLVRLTPDGSFSPIASTPVLTPAWIYQRAVRTSDYATVVLATPRAPDAPSLAVPVDGVVQRMRSRDGVLYWLASRKDGSGSDLYRAEPGVSDPRRLNQTPSYVVDFAVGDSEIYMHDNSQVYALPLHGGGPHRFATATQYNISAITVHHDHVFWVDGQTLMAKRRGGGAQFTVAQAPPGYGGSGVGADIVFDDDYAYLTNFGTPGLARVSENGKVDQVGSNLPYPGGDLIKLGDQLYFWASGGVYRQSLDDDHDVIYRVRGDGSIVDLVSGAGLLYVSAYVGDFWEVTRIDPSTGDAHTVLRWYQGGNDSGTIAADDNAVYVPVDALGSIVEVRHDAPALPDPGWARSE